MMRSTTKLILGSAFAVGYGLVNVSAAYAGGNGNGNNGGNGGGNGITEVTGELATNQIAYQPGVTPTIGWVITRPVGHTNNGHGNNVDGVDSSNPGQGGGGPNGAVDSDPNADDEIRGGADGAVYAPDGDNTIRQTDLDTGIRMDIVSSLDVGEATALLPIQGSGAEFELWGNVGGTLEFLDSTVIGPYMPNSGFSVTSQDPWIGSQTATVAGQVVTSPLYRTRADIAYSVQAAIGHLSLDPLTPRAAREVSVQRAGASAHFDLDTYTYPLGDTYLIASGSAVLGADVGDTTAPGFGAASYSWTGLSALTGFSSQAERLGIERFEALTFPDTMSPISTIGKASIVVWPVANGFFTQLDGQGGWRAWVNGQTFTDKVRNIYVNYRNLYPGAKTFVQIYKGAPVLGQVGLPILAVTKVPSLTLPIDIDGIAQNTVVEGIVIRDIDLQQHINYMGNGTYTLEILSGGLAWLNSGAYESLGTISFSVTQSVNTRAQIGTQQ